MESNKIYGNPTVTPINVTKVGNTSTTIPCSSLEGVIYIEDTNLISGSYTNQIIGGDGSISDAETWVLWDDVVTVPNPTEKTTIYRYNTDSSSFVVMYDKDGKFKGRVGLTAGVNSCQLQSNTYTVRFIDQITHLTAGQTYSWSEVTHFVPYGAEAGYNFDGNPMYADLKEQIKDALELDISNEQISVALDGDSCTVGYINVYGNIATVSNAYRTTEPIFVKQGATIKYKLWGAKLPIIACYDENNTYLGATEGYSVTGNETTIEGEYIAPADVYIRFVNNPNINPDGYVHIIYEQKKSIKDYVKDLPTKEYLIDQANNVNEAEFSLYDSEYRSGWLDNSGTFKSLASYRLTEPVFVKASTKIEYRLKHATTAPIIALYSENVIDPSKKIDLVKGINGVSEGEYVVPSDGYICFVTLANYTDGYVKIGQSIFGGIKEYVNNKVQNANNLNLNILCLGDSIFGNDGEIVSYLAQFTGSNVINGAIGGTRASVRISNTDAFQYLDGKNLVQALTSGDWTNQDTAVTTLGGTYPWMQNRIANLKTLDMSKVDLVTMDWGTNDYTGGQTKDTILSAYDYIIDTLQSTYPELRILITTPIWRYFDDTENGDNREYADATLKEIAEAIETFAKEKRVHVLNAYQNMPLSYNTATTYFDVDSGVHLNKKGNEVYAHLLNGKIRSLY